MDVACDSIHSHGLFLPTHRGNFFVAIVMAFLLALFAVCPSEAYAQDSVAELETDTNTWGKKRAHPVGRVFAEFGMGLVGLTTAVAFGGLGYLGFGIGYFFGFAGIGWVGIGLALATVTPLTAELVYWGGRLTGGRGVRWPTYVGGYVGFATGALLCLGGFASEAMLYVGAIAVPVLSLVGSIVGYELSEKNKTDHLKSERDKILANQSLQASAPIMITLYQGRF